MKIDIPTDNILLQNIQNLPKEYDGITNQINHELNTGVTITMEDIEPVERQI
jgi:hypothetical protein